MKRFLPFFLFAVTAFAQNTACNFDNNSSPFTGSGNGTSYQNYTTPPAKWCNTWVIEYWSTGFSALSLSFQVADDSSGSAGTFADLATGILSGTIPSTGLHGTIIAQSFAPWVRIKVNSTTGTGTITYRVSGSNGISGFGAATTATITPTGTQNTNLIQVGGSAVALGQAAGAASIPVVPASDVTAKVKDACGIGARQGPIILTGAGDTRIVSISSHNVIYVCDITFATAVAEDIFFDTGTGTNCGTGTASSSGTYRSVTTFAFKFGGSFFASGKDLCINQQNAQNLGGMVHYLYDGDF